MATLHTKRRENFEEWLENTDDNHMDILVSADTSNKIERPDLTISSSSTAVYVVLYGFSQSSGPHKGTRADLIDRYPVFRR